jgi:integrase
MTLRQVLDQAVINGLVTSHPVERVAAPKIVRPSKRALTSEEARQLVEAALVDRLGAAVALLFVHGWRVSEVLGLAWDDVDLELVPPQSVAPRSTSTESASLLVRRRPPARPACTTCRRVSSPA